MDEGTRVVPYFSKNHDARRSNLPKSTIKTDILTNGPNVNFEKAVLLKNRYKLYNCVGNIKSLKWNRSM